MGDIKTYKCPNCDGAITFDATAQKMKCPYCKTEIDVASLVEYEDDKNIFKCYDTGCKKYILTIN